MLLENPEVAEPLEFVAVTVNEYIVFCAKPETEIGDAPDPEPPPLVAKVFVRPPVPFAV
jgi:hypothetical protein